MEVSHVAGEWKFLVYKAAFSLIGVLMNSHYLPNSERCASSYWDFQLSHSEDRQIVSPCILITPDAFDLSAACHLNIMVLLLFCSSHQAGHGCSGNGFISLSAALVHEAVMFLQLGQDCVIPRALCLGTPLGHGAPHQPQAPIRCIPPCLVIDQVCQAHPFSQNLVCHWLLSVKDICKFCMILPQVPGLFFSLQILNSRSLKLK